jgi:type IV pilus assembly protein PilW
MSPAHRKSLVAAGNRSKGFSLVELMIALLIGLIMVSGALTLYVKTKDNYNVLDTTSQLQESGRYAMSVMEDDARMASFWGLTNNAASFTTGATAIPVSGSCGTNWATDIGDFIGGMNETYGLTCAAFGNGAQPNTDVLIVRRASAQRIAQTNAAVQAWQGWAMVATSRSAGALFVADNTLLAGYDNPDVAGQAPVNDTRPLVVDAYYISKDSSLGTGYPSLRVQSLGSGPSVTDTEVMAGVEDLQVQFGLDNNAYPVQLTDPRVANVYVDAGAVPAGAMVVSLRIWLRVRARQPDMGFIDGRTYTYADENAAAPGDHFHRFVIERTIQLRNTRQ